MVRHFYTCLALRHWVACGMANSADSFSAPERILADGLACKRGGRMVFEDLSFDIGPGEYLHLAGSNGSGKSTLLRVIAGLIPYCAGALRYGDELIEGSALAASGLVLYAGHQNGLKAVWTLRQNCENLVQTLTGKQPAGESLETTLEGFALQNLIDQPVRYFSSGQLHRASLLKFLLINRPIWLMDEPTVGLDAENRRRLESIMAAHLEKGGMIFAASHDPIAVKGQSLDMRDFAATQHDLEYWT